MSGPSRHPTARAVALAALLVVAPLLAACGESTSSPTGPTTSDQPTIGAILKPTANPKDVLAEGFEDAFEAAAPGVQPIRWARVVRYYLGGNPVRTLKAEEVRDPSAWTGCPPQAMTYAARDCPISLRATVELAAASGDLVAEVGTPAVVGCDRVTQPARTDHLQAASLRPDPDHRDCFSDFAITLYVNADRQVEAVNLVLSSP